MELVTIRTKGDIMQDVSLAAIGGKGLFIKEIEEALLRGDVDLAVHSMKDVPAELPEALEIAVTPLREDPRDVLISRGNRKLEEMPHGARIGTGSLRRAFQLRNRMPDLEIVPLRGNLDTRIRKLETEGLDGVIVAAAGIRRMGWASRVSQFIPVELMLPAVGQGVIGIETRRDDARCREVVAFLNDPVTFCEVGAERGFLKRLGGGCQLPIAAFAKKNGAGDRGGGAGREPRRADDDQPSCDGTCHGICKTRRKSGGAHPGAGRPRPARCGLLRAQWGHDAALWDDNGDTMPHRVPIEAMNLITP